MVAMQQDMFLHFANEVADIVVARLNASRDRVLVSREELAQLLGLSVRTIDRMANGGSWERDPKTRERVWRPTKVTLQPIRCGGRVLFDRDAALEAIKQR